MTKTNSVIFVAPLHHGENKIFRESYGNLLINRLPGWEFTWYDIAGCGITHARDIGAARCVKDKYDVLFFVASDIGFTAKDCQSMLSHFERDPSIGVVGGMYLLKKFPPRLCMNQDDRGRKIDAHGLLEVRETGSDFLAIRREALEKVISLHPELEYDDYDDLDTPETNRGKSWNIFNMGVVEENGRRRFLTEDFWWCRYAREAGYKIHVDTNVRLRHAGGYVWDADEYLRSFASQPKTN